MARNRTPIEVVREYRCAYPFNRMTFSYADDEGSGVASWVPGHRYEWVGPEDTAAYADALGEAIFRVVDVHKLPRPYPTRVFYTRTFVTPDGKTFGKKKLHITTLDAFRRRIKGYIIDCIIEDRGLEGHQPVVQSEAA